MYLEILRTETAAEDAVSIYFIKPEGFTYKAGQHGLFSFSIDGQKFERTYSFHTAPHENEIGITVRAIDNGMVSNYIQRIKPGISIPLVAIGGNVFLEPAIAKKRHLIMLAGGAGITPILSMIKMILTHEQQASVSLIYTNRNYHRIIFRDELRALESAFPGRLTVYHIITKTYAVPDDFSTFYKGRLTPLIIRQIFKKIRSGVDADFEYIACGPNGLMDVVEQTLHTIDPLASLRKEVFYIQDRKSQIDFESAIEREIILHTNDDEKLVIVKPGQSILQAAREQGIIVPFSCTEGQCGTCRAKLISGEVRHRKNHILTENELKDGYILLCQGFPVSNGVAIRTT